MRGIEGKHMQKITVLVLLLICLSSICPMGSVFAADEMAGEQANALGLPGIIDSFNSKTQEIFPGFDSAKIVEEISKGNLNFDSKGLFKRIAGYFLKEVNSNISIIIKVIIIAILCSILKSLQENLLGNTSEIAFYVCYLLMVSLIIVGLKDAIQVAYNAVNDIVAFMQAIIPALVTLMISMGNVTSTGILYPLIITVVGIVSTVIGTFVIPAVLLVTVLSIVGNISNKVEISKLGALIKTITIWTMGVMLTVFVSIVSVQAGLAGTIDGVTAKTVKFAFSKSVPFVGQILSDSVETVLGCSLVIKNAVGVVGMILIIGIVLIPLIKILAMAFIYKIAAVVVQPLSDARITNCLDDIGGTLMLLFSIVLSVSFMFIVAITALIRTGNVAAMIR